MILNKKNIFLFFILTLCFANTNAYHVPHAQDTSKTHVLDELATRMATIDEFKISKNEFINKYGFDEVAIKKINSFFKLRNIFIFCIISPFIIIIVFFLTVYILLLAEIISFFTGGNMSYNPEKLAIPFALLYIITWLSRIYSLIKIWKFKKYNLLLYLVEYRKQYNLNNQKND